MIPLKDTDRITFGKYKGVPLEDVPARYFFYLWTHGMDKDLTSPVADYIRRNLEALKREHPDGIW